MSRAPGLAALLVVALAGGWVVEARSSRSAAGENEVGLGTGYRAPGFSADDLAGTTHRVQDYEGKVVVLHFWATWCPYCRSEIPELKELQHAWAGKGVQVLAVSTDQDVAQLRAFVKAQGLAYPVIADADRTASIADQFGVQGIPVTYVIGRDGRIAARLHGASEILQAVQRVLDTPRA